MSKQHLCTFHITFGTICSSCRPTRLLGPHHLQHQLAVVPTMPIPGEEELPPPAPDPRARRPSRPPKQLIETAASGNANKRAKPAQLVYALPASSSWVSCDDCKKWRWVAQEPTAEKWCCSENQDAKHTHAVCHRSWQTQPSTVSWS